MALRTLKKIHVMPFALIFGVIEAVLGLIIGIITFLLIGLLSTIPGFHPTGPMMLGGGIVLVIVYPVMFFIIGFIVGAILSVVYNLIAPATGGIKVEVE
jgi:membrane-anchored glycerophosphoryl diester phosphodiesterase (GDPDase)